MYDSYYGTRYQGYYNHNTYYYNNGMQKITSTAKATGVMYQINSGNDLLGILSPFYGATTLPSNIATQQSSYQKAYIDWISSQTVGGTLIESCPISKQKCRVCNLNGCFYFTKSTTESYDKYCVIE